MNAPAPDLFGARPALVPPDGEKGQKERGAFYTPDQLALAICSMLREQIIVDQPRSIFEPGCGGGSFLRAAHATWLAAFLYGVDLVPACEGPGHVEQRDLFTVAGEPRFDLVVGNPDFSIAEKVVRHCLPLLVEGGHLALLLLASFEESAGRVPLFDEYPLFARQILAQRASFTADGAMDQRPYAVFVWRKGFQGPRYQGLRPLVWR
jgi:hypothetical protein